MSSLPVLEDRYFLGSVTVSRDLVVTGDLISKVLITEEITDPGDGAAIPVTSSGSLMLTSGGSGETRTLAIPTFVGQRLSIGFDTDGGGDIAITVAAAVNQAGNTTLTGADAGDHISLEAITVGGSYLWRILANDGFALS